MIIFILFIILASLFIWALVHGGNWYDIDGNAIAPSAVPDKAFGVYYATPAIAEEDMNQMVLVKKGSLMKTAKAIRTKTGTVKGYEPAEFADAILSSEVK